MSKETDASKKDTQSTSLGKMLTILDMFTPETPVHPTTEIIARLGTSRSTAYRYIQNLNDSGLLQAVGNGNYILGPRIIELDYQIRNCDPMHIAADGVLDQLADDTGESALLCMLYSNSVLCVRESHSKPRSSKLFSRGQSRSLFRGAMSKVILPYLPYHQLRKMYARSEDVIEQANLGTDWSEFKRTLNDIRKSGCIVTSGEFYPDVTGVAAPVFNGSDLIVGSVGVAGPTHELLTEGLEDTKELVKTAAGIITERLHAEVLPPRAVG
ncbi:MAG: IclR family transcriptional regulator [Pseudomonadota bacterium]